MISYIEETRIELDINGEKRSLIVRPADTLLRVLRENLGLTGAKPGCENGDCGACTILLDGIPIKSCIILAVEAVGHKLITIEGLKEEPIQKAFIEKNGFSMWILYSWFHNELLWTYKKQSPCPHADDETIEEWLQSNICRCTGYEEIREAVKSVLSLNKK
ncbi:[2Fe-2S] binding domain protein [Clostridium argentinense CDC 2741]|uniref:[2Fe-2S] binding domain protein n=1 Tax=Clostridium argentinense CDC 2741 TaxID=1418104 RepID=A0A0C1R7M9_9CLOT|nr:2Fe-2S iron-sulfur cluster-binding protein [Clostridium argentinense]KIE46531.1 [2Fe-2S] binding domain protein [Clostridium argentinense CDC 2741]